MTNNPRGVLFDLDGTLIDHFNVIYQCYEYTLRWLDRPVPDFETVRRATGGSMEVTMKYFVEKDQIKEAGQIWRQHFDKIFLDDITMLPGARELVEELSKRGYKQAVFTNKIGEQSRKIITHLGLDSMMEFVLGANDTPNRKPQTAFSREVLDRLKVEKSRVVFVGDSPFDIQAAHCVSRPAYCVTTGTHTEAELIDAAADGIFLNLIELAREVFSINLELAGETA
jgi:phosphoglycolate phosphatase-like HAD superfamily hydrolase